VFDSGGIGLLFGGGTRHAKPKIMRSKLTQTGLLLLAFANFNFFLKALADAVELFSKPAFPSNSLTASGSSYSGIMSHSNGFVLFASDAWDLAKSAQASSAQFVPFSGVFVYQVEAGILNLVTRGLDGKPANGNSLPLGISRNQRYFLFESDASNLVENDNNAKSDVFVYDNQLQSIILVSRTAAGFSGNGRSDSAVFLQGGKRVLFLSDAKDLRAGLTNVVADYFIWNLESHRIEWRSSDSLSNILGREIVKSYSINHDLSTDREGKRFVWSCTVQGMPMVLLYDPGTGTTQNVATNLASIAQIAGTFSITTLTDPIISSYGKRVAFLANSQLIYRNLDTGEQYSLGRSRDLLGTSFSASSNRILFQEAILDINQLAVWDVSSSNRIVVSSSQEGWFSNDGSRTPEFVGEDENQVLFLSASTNLVPGVVTPLERLYRKTISTGAIDILGPRDLTHGIESISVSANGTQVLFETRSSGIVPDDNNDNLDLFMLDIATGRIQLVSKKNAETAPSGTPSKSSHLGKSSLSIGGGRAVFSSAASNLATNDHNNLDDVFVHALDGGQQFSF